MKLSPKGITGIDVRAQSEVLGVVLLLGLSITTIGMIFAFSQPSFEDASDDIEFDRMENEMSLLDAKMATSALGSSERQEVDLNIRGGTLSANPDESWMNVTHSRPSGNVYTLANISMGNVRYVRGDREIAYEGGGVWKKSEGSDQSVMVSTPELHYRGSTLTLPAFNVTNRTEISGNSQSVSATSEGDPDLVFPDSTFDNPLRKGNVSIKVKSNYYRGWEDYFRGSTTAAIQGVYDSNQTVEVELLTPTELPLSGSIMYDGGINVNNGYVEDPSPVDIDLPSADTFVDPMVDKCQGGGCADLDAAVTAGTTLSAGNTYWHDGDYVLDDDTDANPSTDNVTIVVNGDLELHQMDFDVQSDDNPVEMYVKGDLELGGNADINNNSVGSDNASALEIYVTDQLSDDAGNPMNMAGIIYAPDTTHGGSCSGPQKFSGNIEFYGSMIVDDVCVNSNSINFNSGDTGVLDLSADVSLIRYLHITENRVRLE